MNQKSPLISVIMAVYNGEKFIIEALESIVQQDYPALEIIVVDDGSTDATASLVKDFARNHVVPLRYAYQENQGQPAAQNCALRLVQGEVITFLDADDLWPSHRLDAQLARLLTPTESSSSAPSIVLGKKQRFIDGATVNQAELDNANNRPFHYSLAASLFTRKVFSEVGLFDQSLRYQADWDWFIRAKNLGILMAVIPEVTVLGRIHTQNITRHRELTNMDSIQMLKKHIRQLRDHNDRNPVV